MWRSNGHEMKERYPFFYLPNDAYAQLKQQYIEASKKALAWEGVGYIVIREDWYEKHFVNYRPTLTPPITHRIQTNRRTTTYTQHNRLIAQYTALGMQHVFGMDALPFFSFLRACSVAEVDAGIFSGTNVRKAWDKIDTNATDSKNRRYWKQLSKFLSLFFHMMYAPLLTRGPDLDVVPSLSEDAFAIIRRGVIGVGLVHTDAGPTTTDENKLDGVLMDNNVLNPVAVLIGLSQYDRCAATLLRRHSVCFHLFFMHHYKVHRLAQLPPPPA